MELEDGTILENNFKDKDKIKGISFQNKKKEGDYSVDEITTVYIHDTEVLPVKIYWHYKDIYSAKGYETTGETVSHETRIVIKENGHVGIY